jgi:hypothetical protein
MASLYVRIENTYDTFRDTVTSIITARGGDEGDARAVEELLSEAGLRPFPTSGMMVTMAEQRGEEFGQWAIKHGRRFPLSHFINDLN